MHNWFNLNHHHSGKLQPHHHTSYGPLGILLLIVGLVLGMYTTVSASPGPQSGSVGLSGQVPAKPPTVAATIGTPSNGQHFSTSPITVTGSCPAKMLVELFKNNIFAGSTICTDTGTYSLQVDLLIGKNDLNAQVYDALNQAGPPSNLVTVYYDVPSAPTGPYSSLNFGGEQLILNTEAVFRGTFPNQELHVPIEILGGTAPYAVNVQWGDSSNKIIPRGTNIEFTAGHVYTKPGTYQISIQASDANGQVAFLTVAAIVNGQPDPVATPATASGSSSNMLIALWPLYTSAVAVVISFWLGERREKSVLLKHGLVRT